MRCPACNTENTPDSRFCGGCGAKLVTAEPRVAPTTKIPDDAPLPPAAVITAGPNAYAAGPISYAPPSMPPTGPMPAPMPATPLPIPRVPEASLSMPVPRRRTGLIAAVIVIDLALAGSGAVLLAKGLDSPAAAPAATAPAPTTPPTPTATTAPIVTPVPTPIAAAGSAAGSDDALGSALAHIADTPTPTPTPTPAHKKPMPPAPQDPYADRDLANEVELAESKSETAFERCASGRTVHGAIYIAFEIRPDGLVDRIHATQNSTGAPELASCLGDVIKNWPRFATHPTHSTSFQRPFSYP